jgi:Zn-dependent metalloprotease
MNMNRNEASVSCRGRFICSFVPPYLLQAIANSPAAPQWSRESATKTLTISNHIRDNRSAFLGVCTKKPMHTLQAIANSDGTEPQNRDNIHDALPQNHNIIRGRATGAAPSGRYLYDCNQTTDLPGKLIRPEDTPMVEDRSINHVYDGLGIALSFFTNVFGRKSIDDASLPLVSSMHYGYNYNDAFWDGHQMVFGDGDGIYFNYSSDSLDVIVHELTHGITQYTAQLEYRDECGALNESISDVFACMAEQWHSAQTAAQGDWIIGQNLFPVARKGVALRSLKSPGTAFNDPVFGKDRQVAHMRDYVKTDVDDGGVHINSGIPNHAFYLVAIELGGQTWERAGQIWYRSLTDSRVKPSSTFKEFAEVTFENAKNMFGSMVGDVVKSAWVSVGVL